MQKSFKKSSDQSVKDNKKQMKILFLGYGPERTNLIHFLQNNGETVVHTDQKLEDKRISHYDLCISFGYRHIIKSSQLKFFTRPPVNLHISFLPYNRGAHPNFWAWAENTPHGVTIHHIDEGIDTGDIIFQRKVIFPKEDMTFKESYEVLLNEVQALFVEHWPLIKSFAYTPKPQTGAFTHHSKRELPFFEGSWDSKITDALKQIGKR
jgi:methionyl-tRNA formyltransferase